MNGEDKNIDGANEKDRLLKLLEEKEVALILTMDLVEYLWRRVCEGGSRPEDSEVFKTYYKRLGEKLSYAYLNSLFTSEKPLKEGPVYCSEHGELYCVICGKY